MHSVYIQHINIYIYIYIYRYIYIYIPICPFATVFSLCNFSMHFCGWQMCMDACEQWVQGYFHLMTTGNTEFVGFESLCHDSMSDHLYCGWFANRDHDSSITAWSILSSLVLFQAVQCWPDAVRSGTQRDQWILDEKRIAVVGSRAVFIDWQFSSKVRRTHVAHLPAACWAHVPFLPAHRTLCSLNATFQSRRVPQFRKTTPYHDVRPLWGGMGWLRTRKIKRACNIFFSTTIHFVVLESFCVRSKHCKESYVLHPCCTLFQKLFIVQVASLNRSAVNLGMSALKTWWYIKYLLCQREMQSDESKTA